MLSYTQRRNLFGDLCGDSSSDVLTLGDTLMNEADRMIVNDKRFNFREASKTLSTVASQQAYKLPYNFDTMMTLTVTIDTTQYTPQEITSRHQWNILNQSTDVESDIPSHYFIDYVNRKVEIYPIPSSANINAIELIYNRNYKDLTVADYTTGTIVTATNGDETIVGSSTVWTAKMADRWIRLTDSNTANTGDGYWYEIDSITDATNLELKDTYQGISIVAGSGDYTLAQVSLIPESYQMLPIYYSLNIFFTSVQPEASRADRYSVLYERGMEKLREDNLSKSTNPVVSDIDGFDMENPNLYPNNVS